MNSEEGQVNKVLLKTAHKSSMKGARATATVETAIGERAKKRNGRARYSRLRHVPSSCLP